MHPVLWSVLLIASCLTGHHGLAVVTHVDWQVNKSREELELTSYIFSVTVVFCYYVLMFESNSL